MSMSQLWRRFRRRFAFKNVFFSFALLITIATFITGLFAIVTHKDTLLQVISFGIGFICAIFAVITPVFEKIISYRWGAVIRILLCIIIVIFLSCSTVLAVLVIQDPVIKIGVSLPFLGSDSDRQDAIPMFNSIKLAVANETANTGKIGDYTIQLVPFDDSDMENGKIQPVSIDSQTPISSPEDFSNITGDAQVAGIIGPFNSGTAIDEMPFIDETSIPLISPANTADCLTNSAFANKDGFACNAKDLDKGTDFRMATVDSIRTKVLAGYFWEKKGYKEAAIYDDQTPFGRSFANRFQEAWKKETKKDAPIFDLTGDAKGDLQQLSTKPDVILFAGTGAAGIALHNAMENDPTFSHTAFAGAATIMRGGFAGPSDADDIYAISPYSYFEGSNAYNNFRSEYKSNYLKEPTQYSASAYDATMILLKSIEKAVPLKSPPVARLDVLFQADQFRREIINNIRLINNDGAKFTLTGVTGTYHFAPNGDAINSNQEEEATIYWYNKESDGWDYIPYTPGK